MGERSILAVELCLQYDRQAHEALRHLLVQEKRPLSYQEKWNLYGHAAMTLLAHRGLWFRGCWDFYDNDLRARSDFNMWVSGMLTEEGARTHPSGTGDPYRNDPRYMTFTIAVLLVQGSPSERTLCRACDIQQSRLWQGDTFAHILSSMRYLNFASVEASTLYLIPNDGGYALTGDDLKHPKFQYLRPIV
ncbi:MAG: hypothetical protein HOW73_32310 [Polyangiaceae bacterium]|nr:hypothetical protein [Polyangiaceae bacterium]